MYFENLFFIISERNFENVFSEEVIFKKCIFLREQFWKCTFWGSSFVNAFKRKKIKKKLKK